MAVTKSFVACVLFAAVARVPAAASSIAAVSASRRIRHGQFARICRGRDERFSHWFWRFVSHRYKPWRVYLQRGLGNAEVNIFTVLDANGNVLPNASVQPIPEPATWVLFS